MINRNILIVLLFSSAACSSGTIADVGVAGDAAPRADARADARTDTGPIDAGFSDADEADSGSNDSGEEPIDLGVMDAEPSDTGPSDSGMCTPIARNDVCGELANVVAAHTMRCNPELSAAEAQALGERFCDRVEIALTDPAVAFDSAAAGQCLCDLAQVGCEATEPLASLSSCAGVLTGTITQGNICFASHRCAPGLYCHYEQIGTARSEEPNGRPPPTGCQGICEQIVAPGAECYDTITGQTHRCAPGHYCDLNLQTPLCLLEAGLGQNCEAAPCLGQDESFVFSPLQCVLTGTVARCEPLGRATGDCFESNCHELYNCQADYSCLLRPGEGQSCTLPNDVAMPNYDETYQNLSEARRACRVSPFLGEPGFICVQTGTTAGRGTCSSVPLLGQPCGIGPNLSASCGGESYCSGIDPFTLAPIMSTCAPLLAEGATCDTAWPEDALGPQCEQGTFCLGKGIGECRPFNFCFGLRAD